MTAARTSVPARSAQWFDVDRAGFAANMGGADRARAVAELLQNAWDADGATTVTVTLEPGAVRGTHHLAVTDDAPDGFADLTHAYRLYAPSTKRNDPTKRGRFNEGEKKVLALCREAVVSSTTGTVYFNDDGTRTHDAEYRTGIGSYFDGIINLTVADATSAVAWLRRCIRPLGIATIINGEALPACPPKFTLHLALPTVIVNAEGVPAERVRTVAVTLHEPAVHGKAWLYEMGLPVVRLGDDRWSVNVGQKVPLNRDRDNVKPAWLRRLRAEIANAAISRLSPDEASARWVSAAIAAPETTAETVRKAVVLRYGDKAVIFDPSDREANDIAMSRGYTVVPSRAFDKEAWAAVRAADALRPAGHVTPSPKVLTDPDGDPPIPVADWTDGQRAVAAYACALGRELLGRPVEVLIYRRIGMNVGQAAATYAPGVLSFNASALGRAWFDTPDQRAVDALLLHEFSHDRVAGHLDARFADEACRLGALLRDSTLRIAEADNA